METRKTHEDDSIRQAYHHISIRGNEMFVRQTREALSLARMYPGFSMVQPYLKVIQESRASGMAAYRREPTFLVGARTWTALTVWYASAILHDAFHSKLYHENRRKFLCFTYTPDHCWKGKEAERKCLEFQLDFLESVDAPQYLIVYVQELRSDPKYSRVPWRDVEW
jgi:hypothetical protein